MNKLVSIITVTTVINTTLVTATQCAEIQNSNITTELTQPQDTRKEVEMRILKFEEIVDMSKDLIKKLPTKKWEGILAITRGGLVPAGIIAQHMNIRRIEVINIKSYEEKSQGAMQILNSPAVTNGGENWLVIDDLSDTGSTFRTIRKLYPNAFLATLMVKPKGRDAVDLYSADFPQELWLHFPWEPLEEIEESVPKSAIKI